MDYIVHEGESYYDLKQVCETLGLDFKNQKRKFVGVVFKFANQGQHKKHITADEYQQLLNSLMTPNSVSKLSEDNLYRVRKAYGELAVGATS